MIKSEFLKKQQKYTQKLMKATDKAKQYDSLVFDSPLNDELKYKRLRYHNKIAKYQTKLAVLKLSLKQQVFTASPAYFETVLQVTRYAWSHEITPSNKSHLSPAKNDKKQTLKIVATPEQQSAVSCTALERFSFNKSSSNDIVIKKVFTVQHKIRKSRRCKNCPALNNIGACRCENKQRQAG
ncbi:hypothetical protein [uncultured Shewanella sp.]|uniref:hypothetical protein n=1 Tax=uncultured Shewanella sp. TaxID=173975 RepID=UPI00262DC52F|nr:hypothetical protein [uncultured Shewanella sp.]